MTVRSKLRQAALMMLLLALLAPGIAAAAAAPTPGIPAFAVQTAAGGGQTYTLTLQVLALLTALSLLPAILLMMTAFTRIMIVLSILRQALGAGQTPPNQVLLGLALFLTFFVMTPVINRINEVAYQPYSAGTIDAALSRDRRNRLVFLHHRVAQYAAHAVEGLSHEHDSQISRLSHAGVDPQRVSPDLAG